ncbi:uncharacterized protein PV09_01047 [Verruconis gallopava]|uniref:Nuclear matrix protein n=1 Tax=Verruconis gallopava TaxID=253628 RepID=A0A0D2ANM3_9PEZI|nr:uncharacterized protein PV09_01047 [Verruconis gallopava]KIW08110.1 hypothetical protein PV09_01047 [Verruconis gallopava]
MAVPEESAVEYANRRLRDLLEKAARLKTTTDIDPPLPPAEFQGELGLSPPPDTARPYYLAAAEDAARRVYQNRAASTRIQDPDFVEIWNLFDILSVCGDQEQCDPCLVWWLIEELLETQSIDGCRIIFDYLESRRERLVANHFEKKNLVILRAFNELLRRLSRAEEAVFCGRVFVFLFQSFPLGARSSVNLKGDFHKENLTTFEAESQTEAAKDDEGTEAMSGVETANGGESGSKADAAKSALSTESGLYPAFWTMQQAFSNPPEYFFKQNRMEEFRNTLEATIAKFREVPKVNQAAADSRGAKRGDIEVDGQDEFANTFNPKYLTSRELFALELSDLAFQRHILVQALILLDFLLSLTEKSKKKLSSFPNKSLHFDYTLPQSDADWAQNIRKNISQYLTDGQLGGDQEGKYYNRMVETVLSRDKNWVRWKLEFCNQIRQPPVHSDDFNAAQNGAKRLSTSTKLKAQPMGALDLGFLREANVNENEDSQSHPHKSDLPDAYSLVRDVQNVDLDIDMAATDEEKKDLEDQKMSKTWRALRLMSKTKLGLFDKVDDGNNLECFIQPKEDPMEVVEQAGDDGEGGHEETQKLLDNAMETDDKVSAAPTPSGEA